MYMKILGLSCSPRKDGNTVALLNEVLKAAKQDGAEVELYSVYGKNLQPCDGCWGCMQTGKCHIKDDMQVLYDKMTEADGIVYGAPVYFYGMASQAKTIIDRSIALGPSKGLVNKVGGVVTVCGSLGLVDVLKDLYFYIVTRPMLPARFVAAYAGPDGVSGLEQCLKACSDLGRQMVALARMNFKYPEELTGRAIAFGTHTK
jgi:multimeric flavodoxin WrbA